MLPTIQRHTVQVDDLTLSYLEAGEGPPVLLLHGWPTSAQLWRHAMPAIGVGRRVIALDLPGFGDSDKPLSASYSFRFFDRILTGFLDALGIGKTGLAVHDLGGPVGLHWAVANSERITDLALLNTLLFPQLSAMVKMTILSTHLPGFSAALVSPWGLKQSIRFGVTDKAKITDEVAAIYQAPFTTPAARRALLKALQGLHPAGFQTIADGLPRLTMPLCILYGTQDRILPRVADTMARVAAILPHAEVTALTGCGHFLQEDRPTAVTDRLAAFFNGSEQTDGAHLRGAAKTGPTGAAL